VDVQNKLNKYRYLPWVAVVALTAPFYRFLQLDKPLTHRWELNPIPSAKKADFANGCRNMYSQNLARPRGAKVQTPRRQLRREQISQRQTRLRKYSPRQ